MTHRIGLSILALSIALAPTSARGQFVSGSDGSDGNFNPTSNVTIDLAQAVTAAWNTPSTQPGKGVYDAQQWAVVFKYGTINIPSGVTVTFSNHPCGAPVVWLANGNVTVSGTVNLDGASGAGGTATSSYATPGPGGFAGGRRRVNTLLTASNGFGPGGGILAQTAGGGGFGTGGGTGSWGAGCGASDTGAGGSVYGNPNIIPLIGGSGGAGSTRGAGAGGGAGGGAILVACSGNIILNSTGAVSAKGGTGGNPWGGGGSGGAIRLIANQISGSGVLRATGGAGWSGYLCGSYTASSGGGGKGRIRVEAELDIELSDVGDPNWTTSTPGPVFPPSHAPILKVSSIAYTGGTASAPADPAAGVLTTEMSINDAQPATVNIEAQNISVGTAVTVIVIPARGSKITATSTPLAGSPVLSTATAQVTFPPGRSEIQLKANWTP